MHARQVTYFLAVVEHGGFSRAAAALRIAQPSLSQSIRTLERDVGAELFRRSAQGVVLTAAGRALLGPARQLTRDIEAMRDSIGRLAGPSVVDVAAVPPLGTYPGAELVAAFHAAHPDVQVHLEKADHDDRLTAMVRDGAAEVGLTYLASSRADLVGIELRSHELVLVVAPGSELADAPDPVSLRALGGLRMLAPPRGVPLRTAAEAALRTAGVHTRLVVELPQRDTTLDLVAAGVGAALVVDASAAAARARGLVVLRVEPTMRLEYGLIHRDRPLSEGARAFVALARAHAGIGT